MTRTAAVALALFLAACSRTPSQPTASGAPPPGASPAPTGPAAAYVSGVTVLLREPTDSARVPGPAGKDVANYLATLHRGEKVTVLETRADDYVKIRASDDREGWLKRGALLEGEAITEATVLAPADVFDRPDLLAASAKRKIEAGTLLLVVKAKPPFSEVNVTSGPNAWVLTERLATGEKEVSVAKLAEKARWLNRKGKADDAKQILALAREHFAGVPLVDQLAVELGEAPPPAPGGEVVPASATLPAQPAPAAPDAGR